MMTRKQYRVFTYIDSFISRTGVSPTYHNIASVLHLKTDYEAYTFVRRIIAQGFLRKTNTEPPVLKIGRYPTPDELTKLPEEAKTSSDRTQAARSFLAYQREADLKDPASKRERFAYNQGVADAKARMPQNIVEAYERGLREGKRQNTVDLSKAYRDGYRAAVDELTAGIKRA
jgi:hypothetical protein